MDAGIGIGVLIAAAETIGDALAWEGAVGELSGAVAEKYHCGASEWTASHGFTPFGSWLCGWFRGLG